MYRKRISIDLLLTHEGSNTQHKVVRIYKESRDSNDGIPEEQEEEIDDSRPNSEMTSSRRSSSECILDSYDDTGRL